MDFLFRFGAVLALVFSLTLRAETIVQDAAEAWKEGIALKLEADKSFGAGRFEEAKSKAEKAIILFKFLRKEYPTWRTPLVALNKKQLEQMMQRYVYFSTLKLEGMSKEGLVRRLLKLNQSYLEQLEENQDLLSLYTESWQENAKKAYSRAEYLKLEEALLKSLKELKTYKNLLASQELLRQGQSQSKVNDKAIQEFLELKKSSFRDVGSLKEEKEDLEEQKEALHKTIYEQRESLIELEKQLEESEKKLVRANERKSKLQTELNATKDLFSLSKLKKNSKEERKALLSKLLELQESEARLTISNSALRKDVAEFTKDVKNIKDLESELRSLKSLKLKSDSLISSLRTKLNLSDSKLAVMTKSLSLKTVDSELSSNSVSHKEEAQQAVIEDLQDEILELKEKLKQGNMLVGGERASSNVLEELKKLIANKDRLGFQQKINELLASYATDYQLWYLKGFEAYSNGKYLEAYESAKQASGLSDDKVAVLELLAKAAFKLKNYHQALSLYSHLISLDEGNYKYYQSFALVMKALGFRDASEKSLIKAHELNKSSRLVVYNLCVLLVKEKERKADAYKWYEKYLELGGKKVSQLETFFNGKEK